MSYTQAVQIIKELLDSTELNMDDLEAETVHIIEHSRQFLHRSAGFETGAPNAECNDFVLTTMNDQDCYTLLRGGYTAKDLYHHNSYLNGLNLDQLDFVWLNRYLRDAISE